MRNNGSDRLQEHQRRLLRAAGTNRSGTMSTGGGGGQPCFTDISNDVGGMVLTGIETMLGAIGGHLFHHLETDDLTNNVTYEEDGEEENYSLEEAFHKTRRQQISSERRDPPPTNISSRNRNNVYSSKNHIPISIPSVLAEMRRENYTKALQRRTEKLIAQSARLLAKDDYDDDGVVHRKYAHPLQQRRRRKSRSRSRERPQTFDQLIQWKKRGSTSRSREQGPLPLSNNSNNNDDDDKNYTLGNNPDKVVVRSTTVYDRPSSTLIGPPDQARSNIIARGQKNKNHYYHPFNDPLAAIEDPIPVIRTASAPMVGRRKHSENTVRPPPPPESAVDRTTRPVSRGRSNDTRRINQDQSGAARDEKATIRPKHQHQRQQRDQTPQPQHRGRSLGRKKDRSKSRDKKNHTGVQRRSISRNRERSQSRNRERSKSGNRERSNSRNRQRIKSSNRKRSKSRNRDRSKSKNRSKHTETSTGAATIFPPFSSILLVKKQRSYKATTAQDISSRQKRLEEDQGANEKPLPLLRSQTHQPGNAMVTSRFNNASMFQMLRHRSLHSNPQPMGENSKETELEKPKGVGHRPKPVSSQVPSGHVVDNSQEVADGGARLVHKKSESKIKPFVKPTTSAQVPIGRVAESSQAVEKRRPSPRLKKSESKTMPSVKPTPAQLPIDRLVGGSQKLSKRGANPSLTNSESKTKPSTQQTIGCLVDSKQKIDKGGASSPLIPSLIESVLTQQPTGGAVENSQDVSSKEGSSPPNMSDSKTKALIRERSIFANEKGQAKQGGGDGDIKSKLHRWGAWNRVRSQPLAQSANDGLQPDPKKGKDSPNDNVAQSRWKNGRQTCKEKESDPPKSEYFETPKHFNSNEMLDGERTTMEPAIGTPKAETATKPGSKSGVVVTLVSRPRNKGILSILKPKDKAAPHDLISRRTQKETSDIVSGGKDIPKADNEKVGYSFFGRTSLGESAKKIPDDPRELSVKELGEILDTVNKSRLDAPVRETEERRNINTPRSLVPNSTNLLKSLGVEPEGEQCEGRNVLPEGLEKVGMQTSFDESTTISIIRNESNQGQEVVMTPLGISMLSLSASVDASTEQQVRYYRSRNKLRLAPHKEAWMLALEEADTVDGASRCEFDKYI